jgi:acetyltransferase-like isoleucine patch superfamily enzyme
VVEDHVHLCPGVRLAGTVRIGEHTMLGTGSCVTPGRSIGSGTLVGAGSVVVRDLPSHCSAHGNPARVQRFLTTPIA